MTPAEFYDFCNPPDNLDHHFELVDGEVIEMPVPGRNHGAVRMRTAKIISNYADDHGVGHLVTSDCGVVVKRGRDAVSELDFSLRLPAPALLCHIRSGYPSSNTIPPK
jgi:Uma2 family endonuclease